RFMMNSPIEDRRAAMIPFVQFGIDKVHMMKLGNTWPPGGGHQPGHLLVLAFTAVMLDMEDTKQTLREATFFHGSTNFVTNVTGELTLWGVNNAWATEESYWNYIMTDSGNRSNKDPYGYIDGGRAPDGSYQLITAQSHKGEILATHLMPELKNAWNMEEWNRIQNYVDRWVLHGLWTLPDPYAPYNGHMESYGVDFGPDPAHPGEGIRGRGRYPEAHGTFRDQGRARSRFVAALWDRYRAEVPEAHTQGPFAVVIHPQEGSTVRNIQDFQSTAFGIHGISRVQFFIDGDLVGTASSPVLDEDPSRFGYSFSSRDYADGVYTLSVVATDRKGNRFDSAPVEVEFKNR
ncbi:Ig-like domain-containing protein, partial [Balneolaceae bacterium ANBcel3]|nr:Ig-like domain-containing protein [Balneolaceae bacterium ANBcel3]